MLQNLLIKNGGVNFRYILNANRYKKFVFNLI